MKNTTKAHLALLGTNLFFAINFSAIKFLVNDGFIQAFALNLVRVAVSVVLLWMLFLVKPTKMPIQKKHVGRFLLCALLGIAINQLLFVKGLSLTYSIHASLLMLTTPILITILAAWFLKEKLNALKIAGLLLGIGGAVILIAGRTGSSNALDVLLGDVLVIINAVAYTFYFILVKPLMQIYNAMGIIRIVFTIGFFMMLPFCWTEFEATNFSNFTTNAWLALACIAVCGTFLAYAFNIYGIKILGASIAGAYIYSQVVFASVIAAVFMGEEITVVKLVAGGCIMLGVYLSNRPTKTKAIQNSDT
ncbi:MAG TPA: DMT family transporter [Ferruginibacter sp.]|nr:DMT family transporter [Ferruginibacter sp.]HRE64179.1 DMT family transporter [Ferruginibacter sp.]